MPPGGRSHCRLQYDRRRRSGHGLSVGWQGQLRHARYIAETASTRTGALELPTSLAGETTTRAPTGGTTPTFDMGFTLYTTGTTSGQALLNEQPSDAKATVNLSTSTKGTSLGAVMSSSELVYITGGTGASSATSGAITGVIHYFVDDPYDGQQNV